MDKAQASTEKRFESVNEFRAQLNDQAATFLPRSEYQVQHGAIVDKVDAENKRMLEQMREMELRLTSRLDLMTGSGQGARDFKSEARLDLGQFLQILAVVISVAAVIAIVLLK